MALFRPYVPSARTRGLISAARRAFKAPPSKRWERYDRAMDRLVIQVADETGWDLYTAHYWARVQVGSDQRDV